MDYRSLVAQPNAVCEDWLYRAAARLPCPGVLWASGLAVAFPLTTWALQDVGAPIVHVRSPREVTAPLFFSLLFLLYFLVVPTYYAAILDCFDRLRPFMTTGPAETLADRRRLIQPSRRFQALLLVSTFLGSALAQEMSSARLTRFITGDWNAFDIWLAFSATMALTSFTWYVALPVSRAYVLTKVIGSSVNPRLFDEEIGKPIAAFGLRAGIVFTIPYTIVAVLGASNFITQTWMHILPGAIGFLTGLGFILVPADRLRRRIRQVKDAEVARINEAIYRNRFALEEGAAAAEINGRILRLLEYRREVGIMREWPLDAPAVRAFGLYFLLVPLTWVASGIVEIIIERWFSN